MMLINIEYIKSWNSIFKIAQLVLGTICVGIIGYYFNYSYLTSIEFFFVATCTFYIGTFLLFASYLISSSAASMIPKTIYELVYNSIASILLLAASIAMMVEIQSYNKNLYFYNALLAASICCLINTILYICSAVAGFRTLGDD